MTGTPVDTAASRRRELFSALASAQGYEGAVRVVEQVLSVDADAAREVLSTPVEALLGRPVAQAEATRPAGFSLHPFRDSEDHRELFHRRSADESSAAGQWDADRTEQERRAGLQRIDAESAMWFVAVDTSRNEPVGLVFGEQIDDGDVDVAIWIRPEERRKGFGLHSLKESRRELAAFFPGKNVIVRAPLPGTT